MVKGISRRVVVLDSPDQRYFEQAIFIVRNDAAGEGQPTGIYTNGENPQTKIKKTSNSYLQQRNLCYANTTRTCLLYTSRCV